MSSVQLASTSIRALLFFASLALAQDTISAQAAAGERASRLSSAAAPTATTLALRVEEVAKDLFIPWSLAFTPDGRLLFTERPCQVRVMAPERGRLQLRPEPILRVKECVDVEDGLRGLALSPQFQEDHYLYVAYTYRSEEGLFLTRVSRFMERDGTAAEERVLLERIPDNAFHNAGRLKFGPDGKLYLATGDANDRSLPQDLSSLAGKVLRFNPDGAVPEDNPFPGSFVYSLGHRNPQGLAWRPTTGQLFITEHGPSPTIAGEPFTCCHDEINLIVPGGNYGWPHAAGVSDDPRFISPVLESGTDTWAPAGADFYRSQTFPKWHGSLFFAALRGEHLHRMVLKGPDFRQVESHERLLEGQYGRLRDVAQGPDGALYVTTSNRDGRSGAQARPGDDRILRVVPLTPALADRYQLVREAYQGVLAREPDPEGLESWAASGLSRQELEMALRASDEGQRVAAVRGLYLELLGRDPLGSDNPGLRFWVEGPLSLEEIRRGIMASEEYRRGSGRG